MKRTGFKSKPAKPMKRTRWPNKPKEGRKQVIAQADSLIQRACLARDKGLCQKCGNVASEGHHIVHRRYLSLRWKLSNVVSLCRECHSLDGTIRRPELTDFCIRWVGGIDAMDKLRRSAHEPGEDPLDAINRLQKELDK